MHEIDQLFQKYYQNDATPGIAVMVIKDQEILLQKGYGLSNLQTRTPIKPHSNFNLASLSKAFTAAAIAMLEENSLLNTSDSIKTYFEHASADYAAIRIKDLIYHTSGLPNFAKRHWKNKEMITNQQIINYLDSNELNFFPGEQFEYNDVGYILLASLIEAITSTSYEEFLLKHIFTPCNMKHTLLFQPDKPKKIKAQVTGYREWPFFDIFNEYPGDHVYGDGSIYSSLTDLYHWVMAIENNLLFSPQMKQKIFESGINNKEKPIQYGYGWFIDTINGLDQYYHQGEWIGFRNLILNIAHKILINFP